MLLNILVIEDNKYDYQLLERSLRQSLMEYDLSWVKNGRDALVHLAAEPCDLILLDFQLPDTNGITLFEKITASHHVPIVFVTGTGNERMAVEALKLGAQDYLVKDHGGEYLKLLPVVVQKAQIQWQDKEARQQAEQALRQLNQMLEEEVLERTEKLQKTESQLSSILDLADDAIIMIDAHYQIIVFNTGAERMLGYTATEALGRQDTDILPFSIADSYYRQNESLLTSPPSSTETYHNVIGWRRDGRRFYAEASIAKLTQDGTNIFATILRDVTERKQAEEALRASEALNQAVLGSMEANIAVLEQYGHIIAVNDAWNRFALENGLSDPEQVGIGTNYLDIMRQAAQTDPYAHKSVEGIQAVINGESARFTLEYPCHSPDEKRWFMLHVTPLTQNTSGVVTLHIDITQQKQIELDLKQHTQRLEIISRISRILLAAGAPSEIVQAIFDRIGTVLPCDQASIISLNLNTTDQAHIWTTTFQENDEYKVALADMGLDDIPGLQEGKPIIVGNIDKLKSYPPYVQTLYEQQGVRSFLAVPLTYGHELRGFCAVFKREPHYYSDMQITLFEEISQLTAVALRQWQLLQKEREARVKAETLQEVARALNTSLDPEQVLNRILAQLLQVVDYNSANIMLLSGHILKVVAYRAASGEKKQVPHLEFENLPHVHQVIVESRPIIMPDTRTDTRWQRIKGTEHILCWVGAPLVVQDEVIGLLNLNQTKPNAYNQSDVELVMAFADQAGVAIQNSQLYAQAQIEIKERRQAEKALQESEAQLAQRVAERTAELSAANEELARTARAKDEFLANMSHELRTPLNAILSMTEIVEEGIYGPVTDKQRHALRTVQESGKHLLSLINDILDVSKIEAGKLTLDLHPTSVQSICDASIRLVQEMAYKKQIELTTNLDPDVFVIVVDGRRLKQILVNLLSNAIKFTPEHGRVSLEVQGDQQQGVAHFTVIDTGIGISEEEMTHLFHKAGPRAFVQLDSALSRRHEGTGLGLTLVFRLTELHNGRVTVSSEVDMGSRFSVSLPWEAQEKELAVPSIMEPPPRPVNLERRKQTILVADDNERNLEAMKEYLTFYGYQVLLARNGHEAVAQTIEMKPDLIFMDVQMPEMDGLTAIQQIRRDETLAQLPIVAFTALAMPGDKERCLSAGANDYLSKPIRMQNLLKTIESYLHTSSSNGNGEIRDAVSQ